MQRIRNWIAKDNASESSKALEALTEACFYLGVERNQYRFGLKEKLNKRFADRKASVKAEDAEKLVLEEIQKIFPATDCVERILCPLSPSKTL